MIYLTKDNMSTSLGRLYQCFLHNNYASVNKSAMTQLVVDNVINYNDLKLIEFIYRVHFCTMEQLIKYGELLEIDEVEARIERLFFNSAINKFIFTEFPNYKGNVPGDALQIICLHEGGRVLLENYADSLTYVRWEPGNNAASCNKVRGFLLNTEFYLQTYGKFNLYDGEPIYYTQEGIVTFRSAFGFKQEVEGKRPKREYIVVDSIMNINDVAHVRRRVRQYETIFATFVYKKYHRDAVNRPMLLIFTDTDEMALEISREIVGSTKVEDFMISTQSRLDRGLNAEGVFLAYDKNEDQMFEVTYPLLTE